MKNSPLILASASPRRRTLLKQIHIEPDHIIAADIDETRRPKERAQDLALRLAIEKAKTIAKDYQDHFILAADTVVACGRLILEKPKDQHEARDFLNKLSGRRHHIYGGICIIAPDGTQRQRLCQTKVQFKALTEKEITRYIESKEWEGKAGGYAIQGLAASFVKRIDGSHSNVVGLSLYDTMQMLTGLGMTLSTQ